MFRALLLTLAACAPSLGELRAPVDGEVTKRLGANLDTDPTKLIAERLAKPLDVDGAVRIALANNPRIRAALAELEIAGSGTAILLGPTTIEAEWRSNSDGSELEIRAIQDILGAITASAQRAAGRADVAVARMRAIATAVRLAGRVEIAFHDLLAAQQDAELHKTAFDAADAAALLRERMHDAGNTSDLALARDRDARELARVELMRAEAAVTERREAVNALLGLTTQPWTAAGRVPEPAATAPAVDAIEDTAVAASVELAAGRAAITAADKRVTEQRLRTVLPHVGVGISAIRDSSGGTSTQQIGPAIEIGIPLLDWNSGGRARARGEQHKATAELAATTIELRAGARAAKAIATATWGEARHMRDVVLPLRQQIVDQTVLHYNAMDADPFAVIAARRELVEAGRLYIDALRRHANAMTRIRALERGVLLDEGSSSALH